MNLPSILKYVYILLLLSQIIGCNDNKTTTIPTETKEVSNTDSYSPLPTIGSASEKENTPFKKINWDTLLPEDYRPEVVMEKYMDQLSNLDDSDPKAMQLYGQIQAELENAPVNKKLHQLKIQLAGFITPLETNNGMVTEFLLVPYYGACIHVPPPPINQTVLIQMSKGTGVKSDETIDPVWVSGEMLVEKAQTDLAQVGYRIIEAKVTPYDG